MVQVSKRLVITKQVPMDTSKELINSLDVALADYHCCNKNFEKGLQFTASEVAIPEGMFAPFSLCSTLCFAVFRIWASMPDVVVLPLVPVTVKTLFWQ